MVRTQRRRTITCECSEIIPAYLNAGNDILVEMDSKQSLCCNVEVIWSDYVGCPLMLLLSMWVFEETIAAAENLKT